MSINFMSFKDSGETCSMYTKSDNIKIKIGSETDDIIREPFESLLQNNQEGLKKSMRGGDLIFDSVDLLYYYLHKTRLKCVRSYIDSLKLSKNKKATINLKNNDYKCFQYALIAALSLKQIKSHPERISNLQPFINQYNWEEINFPAQKQDWKKFELNNKTIALNILIVSYNTEEIRLAYKSKHNFNVEIM